MISVFIVYSAYGLVGSCWVKLFSFFAWLSFACSPLASTFSKLAHGAHVPFCTCNVHKRRLHLHPATKLEFDLRTIGSDVSTLTSRALHSIWSATPTWCTSGQRCRKRGQEAKVCDPPASVLIFIFGLAAQRFASGCVWCGEGEL